MTNNQHVQKRLGVITPVYNGERYIEETINSVIEAIVDLDVEYVVVNDGSTDGTLQIIEKYKEQVIIVNQQNLGESAAVNSGLMKSSADYVVIVNADDPILSREIFEEVETHFDSNHELVAWYPDWIMIDSKGQVLSRIETEEYSDESLIGRFRCLPGPGVFLRKSAALSVGGRSTKWRYVSDYDLWLRLSRVGRLERRPKVLAQWRCHDEAKSAEGGPLMVRERSEAVLNLISTFSVSPKVRRIAKAHYLYFSLTTENNFGILEEKLKLLTALYMGRGRLSESRPRVILYILLKPFSKYPRLIYSFLCKRI